MSKHYAALGICAISILLAAEPVCRRILLPHPHHSAATLASWKEWNQAHAAPAPKPTALEIPCPEVQPEDVAVVDFLMPMDDVAAVEDELDTPITEEPAPEYTPPVMYEASVGGWNVPLQPGFVGMSPTPVAQTAEPPTMLLLLPGLAGLLFVVRGRIDNGR